MMIPKAIQTYLKKTNNIVIVDSKRVGGGCINECAMLINHTRRYFIKWNNASDFPGMFEKEALGLDLLSKNSFFNTPSVIDTGCNEGISWIIMEYIEGDQKSEDYWQQLGMKLAQMHRSENITFGLSYDNYIGSLVQHNDLHQNWVDFFINQRIKPQLKLAIDSKKMDASVISKFEKLYPKLDEIFPTDEKPALIHGDLWSGNLHVDKTGNPCLIDPAVCFANRESEMAYTQLFGGFEQEFYETYNEVFPLASGFQQRVDIYNIYPLLVHVNLFGGGYIQQVSRILDRFS